MGTWLAGYGRIVLGFDIESRRGRNSGEVVCVG